MPAAPPVTEAAAVRPLDPAERRLLEDLLVRASAGQAPGVRVGDPSQALVNLSVPRRGDPTHQSDLVMAGETVYLTGEEAALFNRHGARDGRQVEVVRKLSGPDGSREAAPRIPPRAVSGPIWRPPPPAPGLPDDMPRPDPPGSSHLQYATAVIPEAREPAPGSEDWPAEAVDIAPGQGAAVPEAAAAAVRSHRARAR